jgi:predicted DNA-binding ribbon-helix-helix protein
VAGPDSGGGALGGYKGGQRGGQAIRKHSLTIAGHRTSLSLEAAFWDALKAQARAEGVSLATLVERIDRERQGNLSSAVRVYLLEKLRERAGGQA